MRRLTIVMGLVFMLSACAFAWPHHAANSTTPADKKTDAAIAAPAAPQVISDAAEKEALSQLIIEFQDADGKLTQADAAARLSVAVPLITQRQARAALEAAIAAAQKKYGATGCQLDFKTKAWMNCPAPAKPADAKPADAKPAEPAATPPTTK